MSHELAKTPLHAWHVAQGGRMVDFAGWSMPVQYTSITAEHLATRTAAGVFDISHMGRFCFAGPDACRTLEGLLTRRVDNLTAGKVRYSFVTNNKGGVLDDVLVSHLTASRESFYWLVVNASNRQKLIEWITPRIGNYDVRFTDETLNTAMIAVQGPRSLEIVDAMFTEDRRWVE